MGELIAVRISETPRRRVRMGVDVDVDLCATATGTIHAAALVDVGRGVAHFLASVGVSVGRAVQLCVGTGDSTVVCAGDVTQCMRAGSSYAIEVRFAEGTDELVGALGGERRPGHVRLTVG